jgi:hypothetical protein
MSQLAESSAISVAVHTLAIREAIYGPDHLRTVAIVQDLRSLAVGNRPAARSPRSGGDRDASRHSRGTAADD